MAVNVLLEFVPPYSTQLLIGLDATRRRDDEAMMAHLERLPENPYNFLAWVIGEPDIGEGCWIGAYVTLDGSGGLTIGDGCQIGNGTQIITHDTVRRTLTDGFYDQIDRTSIEIGDHVFIGVNAVILRGARIGHHCIVAAGSVVLEDSDFPPHSLIAGNPAVRKGNVEKRRLGRKS